MSPDFKQAKVLVSISSSNNFEEDLLLSDLKKLFARAVSAKLVSKYTPQINVARDFRIEDDARISKLTKN